MLSLIDEAQRFGGNNLEFQIGNNLESEFEIFNF